MRTPPRLREVWESRCLKLEIRSSIDGFSGSAVNESLRIPEGQKKKEEGAP